MNKKKFFQNVKVTLKEYLRFFLWVLILVKVAIVIVLLDASLLRTLDLKEIFRQLAVVFLSSFLLIPFVDIPFLFFYHLKKSKNKLSFQTFLEAVLVTVAGLTLIALIALLIWGVFLFLVSQFDPNFSSG